MARSASAQKGAPPGWIEVGRRKLKVTNLDKVLYPAAGFTKGEVIEYYARIAPVMLPHLRDRPVTLKRYPSGVEEGFFFEKMCPSHRPDWVERAAVKSTGGKRPMIEYCLINDVATLVWVANLAALELHPLLARKQDLERPTAMVFDLDPGEGMAILDCCRVGLHFRDLLLDLGLKSFVKTSGGKGLHLYVPLNGTATFDQTKTFSRTLAQVLEKDDPKRITTKQAKDLRTGRILIDWSQNDRHKTTACVYCLRATKAPAVSTPLDWAEIEAAVRKRTRLAFTPAAVLERVEERGDLFSPVLKLQQKLPAF